MSLMGEGICTAPRNEFEQKLADIWCQILKLEQIGIYDNFFSMGGDSILSIQIVSRIKALGFNIDVSDLFKYSTIAKLGENLIKVDQKPIKRKIIQTF